MGLALEHLSESERIAIARDLFTGTSDDMQKGELHGLCPLHEEKNPSFAYNFVKDRYNCFGCNQGGDLIDLWIKVHGHDSKQGVRLFCQTYGINKHEKAGKQRPVKAKKPAKNEPKPDYEALQRLYDLFKPLPDAWIDRLEEKRGWTKDVIARFGLRLKSHYIAKFGAIVPIKKPDSIAIPVFDVNGALKNIRVYRPEQDPKIISWAKGYGRARLFPPKPPDDSRVVLLCEGESDTLCALSNGFCAITQTSKLKKWPKAHLAPFKGRDVVIAYDADEPGLEYAKAAAACLADVAASVRVLAWPEFMLKNGELPEKHGQDLTDFFVKYGRNAQDLQDLVTKAPPHDASGDDEGIYRFFKRGVNDRFSFKPRLLAEQILKDMDILHDPKTTLMYRWNGRYWVEFEEDHIRKAGLDYLGDEAKKSWVEDVTFQVRHMSVLPHGRAVNDRDEWVCIQNGMLNLKDLELRPHDRDFCATHMLGVKFEPKSPKKCDRWLRFLKETIQTPEAIMQAQEFVGYCLTRETRFGKCLMLKGPGADGKSQFLWTIKRIVGDENTSTVGFKDLEDQFSRSGLFGKLFNFATEMPTKALESSYFKAIITGDPINAAFKHKNQFQFTPYCKMAFSCNRWPRVLDNTDGFFRRLLPIEFKRQFLEGDADLDVYLQDKLEAELSEIFIWAIEGLHRLWENGRFTDCDETRELMLGYRRENNPVMSFVEDRCELGEDLSATKDALFSAYLDYCSEGKFRPFNRNNFFKELWAVKSFLKQMRRRVANQRVWYVEGIQVAAGDGF